MDLLEELTSRELNVLIDHIDGNEYYGCCNVIRSGDVFSVLETAPMRVLTNEMKRYMGWVNARPKGVLFDSRSFNMKQTGLKEHIDMLKRFRHMYLPHHEVSD
eukprot:2896682-Karenia_brevis.AAC.1